MVTRPMCPGLLALLVVGLVISSASATDPADYRLGDQVIEDMVTPMPLVVIDPLATKALQDKEAQRLPVIFRFHESALATVEADLRATFSTARSNFVFLLQDSFQQTRLTASQIETDQFRKVIDAFRRRDSTFPLSEEMAREWAHGNVVIPEQIALLARIHQAMAGLIRHENLTNTPQPGNQVLLVPAQSETETITLEDVTARGSTIPRTNLLTISLARQALLEKFAPEQADMAKFAALNLRENCFLESDLTRAIRARYTESLLVADNYQAGQVIARQGTLVDAKVMAALSQLQEKTAADRRVAQVTFEREQAERRQAQTTQIRKSNQWLTLGSVVAGGLLILVLFTLLLRRRRAPAMPPLALSETTSASLLGASPAGGAISPGSDSWQQRALAAEEMAQRAQAAIRSGVLDQFKGKLVGSLISQRAQMLETQSSAVAEIAEMERRLTEFHAPLQERLRAYESRIADLEQALAAKGEENRELIKAKIELMRKQLEAERSGNHLLFN